jgi:Protein of unknown function (DUF1579)
MPDRYSNPRDERLATIAGHWRTSGHVIGQPNVPVTGTDTYEVVAGGLFLLHRVDVSVGDRQVQAIEVIGERDSHGGYLARSFDSDGNTEVMRLTIDDGNVFHFTGGGDIAPTAQPQEAPTAQVRSTLTVAIDRESMTAQWERSEDGATWHPWMDIRFSPVGEV